MIIQDQLYTTLCNTTKWRTVPAYEMSNHSTADILTLKMFKVSLWSPIKASVGQDEGTLVFLEQTLYVAKLFHFRNTLNLLRFGSHWIGV